MDMELCFLFHEAVEHEKGENEIGTEILRIREIHLRITDTNGTNVVVRKVLREDTRQGDANRDRLRVVAFRYDYLSRKEGGYAVRVLSRHDKSLRLSFCLKEW